MRHLFQGFLLILGLTMAQSAHAQDDDLAKKLANPIASLISVPLQLNYDRGIGPNGDGSRFVLNVQPVVPISIGDNWNLISRTIVPVVSQDNIFPGAGTQFGLGDTVQSFFFSPKAPTPSGLIWGIGPVFLLPTATDDLLGTGKWGAGLTGVALKQTGPWTIGVLGNHIWSFAGDDARPDVNSTFVQPFVSFTTPDNWTFTLQTETSYNWETEEWSVPINAVASKLTRFGNQPVSLFAGLRYWAESPANGPEGFGFRAGVTYLFPK
ncbi:hypothetical protein [Roseovarius litorisediminis]|nr:hypothetical protein [Roseovarius litorisediminis]